MKNLVFKIIFIALLAIFIGCKEQVADDSACPNCPVITKITPEIGQEGNEITIVGQRFGTDKSKVTIDILTEPNKVSLGTNDITSISDSEIKFKVPAGKSGTGKVLVKTNLGTDILTSDDAGITNKPADVMFTFKGKASFTISSLSGKVGDELTIKGDDFGTKKEDVSLKIGTISIPITSVTDKEVKFTLPKGVPAKDKITVTVSGFEVTGILEFTYIIPQVTSNSIEAMRDKEITILGNNFTTVKNEVKLFIGNSEIPQANITQSTPTEIKVKIPKGIGSGLIKLSIYGFDAIEKPQFTYINTFATSTFYSFTIENTQGNIVNYARGLLMDLKRINDDVYAFKTDNSLHIFKPGNITLGSFNKLIDFSEIKNKIPNYQDATKVIDFGFDNSFIHDGILYLYVNVRSLNGNTFYESGLLIAPISTLNNFNNNYKYHKLSTTKKITALCINNQNSLFGVFSDFSSSDAEIYEITKANTQNSFFTFSNNISSKITGGASIKRSCFLSDASDNSGNSGKVYFSFANEIKSFTSKSNSINSFINNAILKTPRGLVFDENKILYQVDGNSYINRITNNNSVITIAGNTTKSGSANGDNQNALFNNPSSIFIGKSGALYINDDSNYSIRKIVIE